MSEQAVVTHTGIRGLIRRLYNWVLHWAETPYGLPALFLISFAESSFFPIPPDILLMALVLGKPANWVKVAGVCTIGSVMGGLLGYAIGFGFWEMASPFFFDHIFSEEVFGKVVAKYEDNAMLTVFTAAFTPIPFKIITIAAGVCKISVLALIAGSTIGRATRFFIVAGLLARFGEPMKAFIDKYFEILTILFTILLIGGFAVLKLVL